MKHKHAFFLGIALLLSAVRPMCAGDPTAELEALIPKINGDFRALKQSQSDIGDDLRQMDALLAEHKGEKTDAVARILYNKALFLGNVVGSQAAAEVMTQLKTEFKDTDFVIQMAKKDAAISDAKKVNDALAIGATFPAFEEKDVAGKPLSLASYKGKVVLVDFWATWCPPCRAELPNVITAYKRHHPDGFDIIGISLDQERDQLAQFTEAMKMPWQQFFDGQGFTNKLAVKYGIMAIPSTFLIDGDGKIVARDLHGEELEQAISSTLAKK